MYGAGVTPRPVRSKQNGVRPGDVLTLKTLQGDQDCRVVGSGLDYLNAKLAVVLALPGLVAIVNTLAINVIERTREIGMLRAVGSTQRQVGRMILAESLLQAFEHSNGLVHPLQAPLAAEGVERFKEPGGNGSPGDGHADGHEELAGFPAALRGQGAQGRLEAGLIPGGEGRQSAASLPKGLAGHRRVYVLAQEQRWVRIVQLTGEKVPGLLDNVPQRVEAFAKEGEDPLQQLALVGGDAG